MSKLLLQVFVFVFLIYPIFSITINDFSNYPPEIIQKIKIGDKEGELGLEINESSPIATLSYGPMGFSENVTIYIFDAFNQRINIYDESFVYLKKIDLNYKRTKFYTRYIFDMVIDAKENIFIISYGQNGNELIMIKGNGEWKRLLTKNTQSDIFHSYNFFSIGDKLFYYNKDNIHVLDLLEIDQQESKYNSSDVSYIIENKAKQGIIQEEITDKNKLIGFLKDNKTILRGDRLLSKDFDKHLKYQTFLKTNLKTKRNAPKIIIDKKISNPIFLGFDSDDNSYWKGSIIQGTQLFIFNKFGETIDVLKTIIDGNPVISPAGDIYYLGGDGDRTNVNIYRIPRRW